MRNVAEATPKMKETTNKAITDFISKRKKGKK